MQASNRLTHQRILRPKETVAQRSMLNLRDFLLQPVSGEDYLSKAAAIVYA